MKILSERLKRWEISNNNGCEINSYRPGLSKIHKDKIDHILRRIEKGRIALWGAGEHTRDLIFSTKLKRAEVQCILDNDITKSGSFIEGIPVTQMSEMENHIKDHVDAIILSSEAFEEEIYKQISHLKSYRIEVHRLYE
jgi:FlaA1/EpsC-like NDP-sugar epimerase